MSGFAAVMAETVPSQSLQSLWGTCPTLQGHSSSWCAASAEGKRCFYSPLMSQTLLGEEKELVLWARGVVAQAARSSVSKAVCQSLAELHLRGNVRDSVPQNFEIKSREQAWWWLPSSSHFSWMWVSCHLEDLKDMERRKWHKIV